MATHESTRKMSGGSRSFAVQDFRKFLDGLPDDAIVKVKVSPKVGNHPQECDIFYFEADLDHTEQEG